MFEKTQNNIKKEIIQGSRFYIFNEHRYPSITNICKSTLGEEEWLGKWKKNNVNSDLIRKYSATLGTLTHWRIEKILANEWNIPYPELELSSENQEIIEKYSDNFPQEIAKEYIGLTKDIGLLLYYFMEWKSKYKLELIENNNVIIYPFEKTVYSNTFFNAGSLDIFCKINGDNTILDLKTSKDINKTYFYQLTGYKSNIEEMYQKEIVNKGAILNLSTRNNTFIFRNLEFKQKYEWLQLVKQYFLNIDFPELENTRKYALKNLEDIKLENKEQIKK